MKKAVIVVLFIVMIFTACGQKEITDGVFIEGIEIREGLMIADLMDAGWRYDIETHTDSDFLQTPVAGGAEVEIKMFLAEGNVSVVLYCENKTSGRVLLYDCPISRFEIYSGDIGDHLTLPGGVTFGDNKSGIIRKLGTPATENDYAIRYDNVPGIAEMTFIMKDDKKTLDRIDIFL